jgi:hypothetical protein
MNRFSLVRIQSCVICPSVGTLSETGGKGHRWELLRDAVLRCAFLTIVVAQWTECRYFQSEVLVQFQSIIKSWEDIKRIQWTRVGAEEARVAHNHKVIGSKPIPANYF